jgi:AAA15 family ATPase/GTPase
MLLRFGLTNFMSVREAQELSLVASTLSDEAGAVIQIEGLPVQLLRVAAIFGSNASGKSNIISGLRFIKNAVQNSHSKWQPGAGIARHPFALDSSTEKPSEFSVDFLVQGVRYEYGFSVDDTRVLHEYLFAYPANRMQRWFERRCEWDQIYFGKNMPGENRVIENLTRPDSLFLSAAAQNNHEKLQPIFNWFAHNIKFRSGLRDRSPERTIDLCLKSEETKKLVLRLLAAADLGIVGMDVKEEEKELPPEANVFAQKLEALLKEVTPQFSMDRTIKHRAISLRHSTYSDKAVPIPFEYESAGTLAFLAILGPVVNVLATGGVLCVDELDASLHPLLLEEIVRIFNHAEHNPLGAQLIFNTHTTDLLTTVLRRDEIWFTEKDNTGATRLYPLSDFKPRK